MTTSCSRGWFVFGFSTEEAAGEPGLGPEPRWLEPGLGGVRRVWPAWSYVVVETGAGLEVRSAGLRRPLPGWTDALPSETHLVLRGPAAVRVWPWAAALRGATEPPAWSRDLPPETEVPGSTASMLPLLPGGFAAPRPPFFIPLPGTVRAQRLVLGHEHVLVLGETGEVYAWGGGRHGQLGHGTLESELQPRVVEALGGVPMTAVAAGGWHSACISEAGDLYVWGWNESGQLALPCKALVEERAQTKDTGPGDAEVASCQEQTGAEDAAFISIQAFPALLDLPEQLEVVVSSTPGAGVSDANPPEAAFAFCFPLVAAGTCVMSDCSTAGLKALPEAPGWSWLYQELLQRPPAPVVSAGKYGQLGHGDNASSDQPRPVKYLAAEGLRAEEVVCGPWNTYVCVLEA